MADSFEFTSTEIPDSIPDFITAEKIDISSDDLTCAVCGTGLTYSGRGRKPKFCDEHKKGSSSTSNASAGRRSSRDVEAACSTLSAAYNALLMPLMMVSPVAAQRWAQEMEGLETRNRMFLEADPALAKKIASAAGKGGPTALVISHAIAVAPVVQIIVSERRAAAVIPDDTQTFSEF